MQFAEYFFVRKFFAKFIIQYTFLKNENENDLNVPSLIEIYHEGCMYEGLICTLSKLWGSKREMMFRSSEYDIK